MIESEISRLRKLGYTDVSALPEAEGKEITLATKKCSLTSYVQRLDTGELLVTIQVARPRLFGLMSMHRENGLIFSQHGQVREATDQELAESGG